MQPLGSTALLKAYHQRIVSSHDYDLDVDVLRMDESVQGPAQLVDGQINILTAADIRRTATFTFIDPDHALDLDADSILQGAVFADRMIRVRHTVDVPGFGDVTCTPIVGPINKVNRNGATVNVEIQDKAGLALFGCPPLTVRKGMNAIEAVRTIMSQRTGEAHFRLPANTRFRLNRHYSVGWQDVTSPWAICNQIMHACGLQLLYSCDGYLTARPRSSHPVFEFGAANLTSSVAGDNDFTGVVNYARTTAGDKIVKTAQAPADHPLSPARLGRNGVPRYLSSLANLSAPHEPNRPTGTGKHRKVSKVRLDKYAIAMEKYAKLEKSVSAQAQAASDSRLAAGLPMNQDLTWSAIPVFHLDVDDPIRLTTPDGSTVLPFSQGSIPLVTGDMSGGIVRQVSKPGRMRG